MLLIALTVGAVAWALSLSGHTEVARLTLTAFGASVGTALAARMARRIVQGSFGVDILAVVAIFSTLLTGELIATWIILVMVAGGSALEEFAERRAEHDLKSLINREPRIARRVSGGHIQEVPVEEVQAGELLLIRAGEVVPVDGSLCSDRGVFDDSAITGESFPVERVRSDVVPSGSVAGPHAVTLEALRPAAESQYQAIVALVKSSAENRAPTVRLADRFALPFTLVSLFIAGSAWLLSGDPVRFAEVVVLATPCPLILAAPVGFIAGMSRSARCGIVVKGGAALETLSRVRTVVADKTGTLTAGRPTVKRVEPAGPRTADELLRLVASAETLSSHVLAESIVAEAAQRGLGLRPASDAREEEARGISATVGTHRVSVGTAAFIDEVSTGAPHPVPHGGEMAIYTAVDGEFAGTVIASDPPRPEAAATVREIRKLGIGNIVMLTGDASSTAHAVAEQLNIDQVRAECLPGDKVAYVESLMDRPVLMVGDGINDAPVLAAAEVGIAMGARGATSASEAADAVILPDDFARVEQVLTISRETVRVVYQSIWVGIFLSLGLMLVAAAGFIPATAGAAIQEVVDLLAVLNSLRALRGRKAWDKEPPATQ